MADNEMNERSTPAPQNDEVSTSTQTTQEVTQTSQAVDEAPMTQQQEEKEEEDEVPQPLVVQAPPQINYMWLYAQSFGIQTFFWLQMLWTALSYLGNKTAVVSKSVIRGLQSKTFVFFQDSNYPYRLQDYTVAGPGIAPVEWYYDADKKLFISNTLYNTSSEYTSHHISWLAGEIKYNDLVLYDVSDFLEQVKWAGTTKPSVARVLSAWSLHSGIVLNGKEGLSLHTINEDGTESALPFRV
jgi:hypothetical protein